MTIKDFKITSLDFVSLMDDKTYHESILHEFSCLHCPDIDRHVCELVKQITLQKRIDKLSRELNNENLTLMPEFRNRMQVLRELRYVDNEDDSVMIKGKIARFFNTIDELIITELLFANILSVLTPPELVAVLSCFVFKEKSRDEADGSSLPEHLHRLRVICENMTIQVGALLVRYGVFTEIEEYVSQTLSFGLMQVSYEWAKQKPFKELCGLTFAQEGSIVRCITRLCETLSELRCAARFVGDARLAKTTTECTELIRRDIIFAESLYVK
jgi:antiviral helicase SKI2